MRFLSTPSARRATPCGRRCRRRALQFLSTPSARRATVSASTSGAAALNFYPRPPRGGRPYHHCSARQGCAISIHALREEGDTSYSRQRQHRQRFLSTPSARRATEFVTQLKRDIRISIHALREEGDFQPPGRPVHLPISIHALREEGDWPSLGVPAAPQGFLSTPSARRATTGRPGWKRPARDFYPRPPRGGRL